MSETKKISKDRHAIIRMIRQFESSLLKQRSILKEATEIKRSDPQASIEDQKNQVMELSDGMNKLSNMISRYMNGDVKLNNQIMVDGIVYVSQGNNKIMIRVDLEKIFRA